MRNCALMTTAKEKPMHKVIPLLIAAALAARKKARKDNV